MGGILIEEGVEAEGGMRTLPGTVVRPITLKGTVSIGPVKAWSVTNKRIISLLKLLRNSKRYLNIDINMDNTCLILVFMNI